MSFHEQIEEFRQKLKTQLDITELVKIQSNMLNKCFDEIVRLNEGLIAEIDKHNNLQRKYVQLLKDTIEILHYRK